MRQIFLDTETTGLEARLGHRIIELACVEMVNRRLTRRHLHYYVNPDRDIDEGALAVHGISREFLADKPRFGEVANEFLDFIRGAELVIHNAAFDVGFLDSELNMLGLATVSTVCANIRDTLKLARELHPGKKNNLNALCERYGVNNSHRTLHGALLDAEILADVYVAMTRGQESLMMDLAPQPSAQLQVTTDGTRKPSPVLRASEAELAEHARVLAGIQKESKGKCLWLPSEPAA
ncbi:MAG: polymerase subunit epsilon [Pseudomonadota bacterium]|jgi:DNA polymerase III subunit epsilon|nr:polymerase subunit epsilon [Pseudomonadota bacterium]MDQ5880652.1 polymerase subunit epsilon [Pseudomonadota bacterium]MDQ5903625.1 polymerase subunit epsilon [Pseudomonadota bacterium]MDQ5907222.1 polymerase subunit epsilon [Pseudomonadota bacterium]MDQ5916183.1 polymerase subunit epsilon [Pseudomonadota bacterium]